MSRREGRRAGGRREKFCRRKAVGSWEGRKVKGEHVDKQQAKEA